MKLTKINIAKVTVPHGKSETIEFDDTVPGWGLRLRAGGSATWIFQYRQGAKQRRISLGSAAAITAQNARERATELHARVRLGEDPAGQKIESRSRAVETFGSVVRPFLEHKKAALKPRTYVEVERHLLDNAKRLHGLQIDAIDRRTVAALLTELATGKSATVANHVRASLSAFYSWAMRQGLADANPVVGTGRAVANSSRDRVLTDDELRSIWAALGNDHYGDVVKLLALTGQRRDEIGSLRWQEFDFHKAVISLPAERTKNGKPHDIPLSPTALTIIKNQPRLAGREYVFGIGANGYSGWSKSKEMLDQRIADNGTSLPAWRLHDLRRSVSTRMHDDLGIPPHIVEAVLNHISGHRAGVAGTYNRAVYVKEKTIALARWAEHLLAIVGGERSKVVAISKGKTRR
jgi:integrase